MTENNEETKNKPEKQEVTKRNEQEVSIVKEMILLQNREVDLKHEEIKIRYEELKLEEQRDKNHFAFSKEALKTKLSYQELRWKHLRQEKTKRYYFAAFVIIVIVAFVIFALVKGEKDFAKEIVDKISYIFLGGCGGYAIGVRKKRDPSAENIERSEDE